MIWPKRPPLAICVAETSVAKMSMPKRPRPKCPWPKCPTFVLIKCRDSVKKSLKMTKTDYRGKVVRNNFQLLESIL